MRAGDGDDGDDDEGPVNPEKFAYGFLRDEPSCPRVVSVARNLLKHAECPRSLA